MESLTENEGCAHWFSLDATERIPLVAVFLQLLLFACLAVYLRAVRRCALRKQTVLARVVILPSFESIVRLCLFSTLVLCVLFVLEWRDGVWCVPVFFIVADFNFRQLSELMMYIAPLEYFLYWFFSNLMYLSSGAIFFFPSLSKQSFRKANMYGVLVAFIASFWRLGPFVLFSNFQAEPNLCIAMEVALDIILFLLYVWVLAKSNNRNFSSRPLVCYNIVRLLLQISRFVFQLFSIDLKVLNAFLYLVRGVCVVPCLYLSLLRDTWYWRGETKLPVWINPLLSKDVRGGEFWNVRMSKSASRSKINKNPLLNSLDEGEGAVIESGRKNVRKSDIFSFIDANDDKLIDFTALDLSSRVVLGRGVSSVVYLGILRNCKVAVKCFNPLEMDEVAIATYQTEVAMSAEASQGDNPYMLEFYGLCVSPPDICMVFELCERGDLRKVLKEFSDMPWTLKFNLAKQCVACVHYLHTMGAIHLDIKPENFFLTLHWQVKLGDFGLARTLASLASRSGGTGCVGTAGYMSPEMLNGEKWGAPTDIFSLAVVIWEIMSQKTAFNDLNPSQVAAAIMNGERPSLSGMRFSAPLKTLLNAAWSTDPAQRPTAAEFESTLDDIAIIYTQENVSNECFSTQELKTTSSGGLQDSKKEGRH